jgi:hypothetical protein
MVDLPMPVPPTPTSVGDTAPVRRLIYDVVPRIFFFRRCAVGLPIRPRDRDEHTRPDPRGHLRDATPEFKRTVKVRMVFA